MRQVLFALEPAGTGSVYRCLAVAEELCRLFPAVEPRFLAAPAAADLLRRSTSLLVEEGLTPVRPDASLEAGSCGRRALEMRRRLARVHAREVTRAAHKLEAELVVVDGLIGALPALSRARFPVVWITDDLLDHAPFDRGWRRCAAALLRRSAVGSTRLRFFVGEPGYLASPELRVWARRYFRFAGPISGLARLDRGDCAALRDDLGITTQRLVVVSGGGSAFAGPVLETALRALASAAPELPELCVLVVTGPELEVSDVRPGWRRHGVLPELYRTFAVADLCIVPGGLASLSECAGLGVPTLCLPLPGNELELRYARFFQGRHGVTTVEPELQTEAHLARLLPELLSGARTPAPAREPAGCAEQRTNASSVADLIAESLGRRRPT